MDNGERKSLKETAANVHPRDTKQTPPAARWDRLPGNT